MSKSLKLNIISAEKTIFSGVVMSVKLPGTSGGFGIYPEHAPLISSLKKGILSFYQEKENDPTELEINGGFVEVVNDVVTVCVS